MKLLFGVFILLFITGIDRALAQDQPVQKSDSLETIIEDLKKRIQALEKKKEADELESLLEEAESASQEKSSTKKSKVFVSGQRSLQAINPEISVTGDLFGQAVFNELGFTKSERTGAYFRVIGLHVQSNLDPFSFAKIALEFSPGGVEFGEAYATWTNVMANLSITAGKFRQQFGIINRWHLHSLDQFDYPIALTTILGDDGLNQTGFSFDWLMPALIADANQFTLQLTNGQNDQLFSGEFFSFPAVLGHLKNYYDLSQNTYLELGLTGMIGSNNYKGYTENDSLIRESNRLTKLAGVDLTVFWEPVNQALYHSFLWRSECYYANKELSGSQNIKAWGLYSYAEYKLDERWNVGFRYDFTQPFESENSGKYAYQLVPYITWWQSHWVRLRLQYSYKNDNVMDKSDQLLRIQLTWAAGPHKHERY
jgi:hypothetical protein